MLTLSRLIHFPDEFVSDELDEFPFEDLVVDFEVRSGGVEALGERRGGDDDELDVPFAPLARADSL